MRLRVCVCARAHVRVQVCVACVSVSALLTSLLREFRAHPRLNWEPNGPVVSDLAVLITEPD